MNYISVIPVSSRINFHEPANDLSINGPFVILTSVPSGRLKGTYSVNIPSPFLTTQLAFAPIPASNALPIRSVFFRNVSHLSLLPGEFGISVVETESEEEARNIMNNDPAVLSGIMMPTIYPYRISLLRGRDQNITRKKQRQSGKP